MIDFVAMAKERAGKKWERADATERRQLVAREKVVWMQAQIGSPEPDQAYGEWLRTQPIAVQDAALGKARATAWREGRIQIEKFVSPPGALTQEQLAARAPQTDERE